MRQPHPLPMALAGLLILSMPAQRAQAMPTADDAPAPSDRKATEEPKATAATGDHGLATIRTVTDLRRLCFEGLVDGDRFFSVHSRPRILAPEPFTFEGFHRQRALTPELHLYGYAKGHRGDEDDGTAVFSHFLALLEGGAGLRPGRVAGDIETLEITPDSGKPCPRFHLALRKSPLANGQVNPDQLQCAIRHGKRLQEQGDTKALASMLDGFSQPLRVFIRRCLPGHGLPEKENYALRWWEAKDREPFELTSFDGYRKERAARDEKVRILVGRGLLSARAGWNSHGTEPLPTGHPSVYTVDVDPATLPDLVADVTSLEAMASIPDGSVDEIFLDGVSFADAYGQGLVSVLAGKLKSGGQYLDNWQGFGNDFEARLVEAGFTRVSEGKAGANVPGYGSPKAFARN